MRHQPPASRTSSTRTPATHIVTTSGSQARSGSPFTSALETLPAMCRRDRLRHRVRSGVGRSGYAVAPGACPPDGCATAVQHGAVIGGAAAMTDQRGARHGIPRLRRSVTQQPESSQRTHRDTRALPQEVHERPAGNVNPWVHRPPPRRASSSLRISASSSDDTFPSASARSTSLAADPPKTLSRVGHQLPLRLILGRGRLVDMARLESSRRTSPLSVMICRNLRIVV